MTRHCGLKNSTNSSPTFSLSKTIAEQVADALLLKLTSAQRRLLTKHQISNVAAYELYLRGLHQLNQYSAAALRQAISFFNEAVKLDPQYVLAYARLGSCYNLLYIYSNSVPSAQLAQLAQAAAERARALDDNLAEAQAAFAQVSLFCRWQPDTALAASQRAGELKPEDRFPNLARGWALAVRGQLAEGLTALRRAQQFAPHAAALNVSLGHMLAFAGRYDEAAGFYQQVLQLVPQHTDATRGLGLVNLLRGNLAEVERLLRTKPWPGQQVIFALLRALGCARRGDAAGARQALAEAQQLPADAYLRSIHVATVYAELSELDEAFAWLERAWAEREPMLITLKVHPFFERLYGDPRFAELLQRLSLPRKVKRPPLLCTEAAQVFPPTAVGLPFHFTPCANTGVSPFCPCGCARFVPLELFSTYHVPVVGRQTAMSALPSPA